MYLWYFATERPDQSASVEIERRGENHFGIIQLKTVQSNIIHTVVNSNYINNSYLEIHYVIHNPLEKCEGQLSYF